MSRQIQAPAIAMDRNIVDVAVAVDAVMVPTSCVRINYRRARPLGDSQCHSDCDKNKKFMSLIISLRQFAGKAFIQFVILSIIYGNVMGTCLKW